jgi:hypothetical protein
MVDRGEVVIKKARRVQPCSRTKISGINTKKEKVNEFSRHQTPIPSSDAEHGSA